MSALAFLLSREGGFLPLCVNHKCLAQMALDRCHSSRSASGKDAGR
jgi:hypothetical protein